ncbi:MAG: penicillin-binding protein activator LpoB [Alcanivorax sp.]|nr:penicillin-binding protein activator LpoB [Alcanivorax sp.]
MRAALKACLLLPLLLWQPGFAQQAPAGEQTVARNASGYGNSPQQAVSNALVEAARQGLGVVATLDPDFRTGIYEWVVSQGIATGRQYSEPEARLPTLAAIRSYRVLDTQQLTDHLWQADIEAQLLTFQSVGEDRRHLPAIAVGSFRTGEGTFNLGVDTPAAEVRAQLRTALVNSLTQSGRVRVLDRDFSNDLQQERRLTAGSLLPEEQIRLGREMGADLMLVGEVRDFQLGRPNRSYYGTYFNQLEPVIRIHYRLIETATGEILRADTFTYRQIPGELRRRLRDADIDPEQEKDRIAEFLFPDVATDLAGNVTDTLYPVRVLAAESGQIYLSQGSGRLAVGALLTLHNLTRELQDPDTGQTIRLESPSLATLRVTQVEQDYAVAELIEGRTEAVTTDATVRKAALTAAPTGGRPMTPGSSATPIQWD